LAIILFLGGSLQPAWGGFLDNLKQKAQSAVEGAVDDAKDATGNNTTQSSPHTAASSKTATSNGATFSKAADAYGRWMGTLNDRSINHMLSSAGFEIFLSDEVNLARVSQLARRCLAELTSTGKPGHYQARFFSGQETCGKSATIAIEPNGKFQVTWDNAPGVAGKTLHGKVERKYTVHARKHWSSTLEERKANDIVGFYPGMTYKQAQAHWQADHKDLKREIRWVRDDGTSSIVIILTPKQHAKAGQRQLNEQISLGFESQTPEELPKVNGAGPTGNAEDLRRANAHLMYVHRAVQFADRKGPTLDTLKAALAKKYGPPSVDKKTAYHDMQWSYGKNDHRIAHAEGGVCDHWQRYSEQQLVPNYKAAQTARVPYITVHPDCGLTIKARVKLFDGAVRQFDSVVYDQQRLMGDQWYRLEKFNTALLTKQRATAKAMQHQQAPDL
jgi:hypothetical protein